MRTIVIRFYTVDISGKVAIVVQQVVGDLYDPKIDAPQ